MQYNQPPMGNQPYDLPVPPAPEKKKNTGLVVGIIVLAVAIVLVSVLGTCFYVKRSGDLRMEKSSAHWKPIMYRRHNLCMRKQDRFSAETDITMWQLPL